MAGSVNRARATTVVCPSPALPGLLERESEQKRISSELESQMTKTLIVAALLSSFAAVSFAQDAASAAEPASAPHKHMKKAHKAHKMHKAASAATDPATSPDKKGGQ